MIVEKHPGRRLVGGASGVAGVLLALYAVAGLIPGFGKKFPLLPFFDRLYRPFHPLPVAVELVVAALLLFTCWAVLTAKPFARWLFLIGGWGGLVFTGAALWPGPRLKGMAEFAINAMIKKGELQEGATLSDLIQTFVPGWAYTAAGTFLVIWIGLLIVGTVSFARRKG